MSLISKAINSVSEVIRKASRGTLTNYVINSPPQYGQPYIVPGDAVALISPERMREVVSRTPTVAACKNAILDYVTNTPLLVRNVDPSQPADATRAAIVKRILKKPNQNDTTRHFFSRLVTDMITLGFAAIEIEPNAYGRPARLHALDAARLKVDFDEHGTVLGYNMLNAHGMPILGRDGVHTWTPQEVIMLKRNIGSSSQYPSSQIHELFSCALIEDMMLSFISGKFTESNIPYGIYDLGDVSKTELDMAIDAWNEQAKSNHKIVITGSRGGSTWTQFGYALKELEAVGLLAEVRSKIMGILGVTMNELGESADVNKSNGYNLSYTFKRRAIEPILNEMVDSLSRWLVQEAYGFDDLELYYEEIDSRDELLQAQIDEIYLKLGIYSPNHIANRKGLPSVAGGDDRLILLGTNMIPIDLIRKFAEAQLSAIEAEVQALKSGSPDAGIKPPAMRGPQTPISSSTPEASGKSSVHISYPRATRGAVQANRNAGQRKEEMTA